MSLGRSDPVDKALSSHEIIWRPDPAAAAGSNLVRFMNRHGISDLPTLQRRSVEDPAWFWAAVEQDLELEWFAPYTQVVDLARGAPWARWYRGGKLNMAHNCVDKHAAARGDALAVVWEGEDGSVRRLTYRQLQTEVDRLCRGLSRLGIGKGDRVGILLPMLPETAVAVLACMKIGAIFTPIFSGYGAQAAAMRLADCAARLLITADGFYRRGRQVNLKETADAAADLAPSVERVLVVRRLGGEVAWQARRDLAWDDVATGDDEPFAACPTDAEDPFMLIYTSGTTGRPKGAVHVHCGFPLKGAQDMAHCFDVRPGDTLFWLTDLGWMMGPWAILGALLLGATVVLYEGTPDYPDPGRLWQLVQRHRVTVLGLSPTVVRALMPHGSEPVERHDLSSLRILGSTGEPWNPEPYMWFFNHVGGGRCPIINYSGGTEISGGIICCFPTEPLKPCAFAGPIPGMAADVVDDAGRSVRGQVGELVIKGPWPGMTRGFWQDDQRYLDTYWSRLEGIWVHGDWAYIDDDGFWFIQGRSDDTLKVAGKRVGPAEVESALVGHPAVAEAAAIGVPHAVKGEAVVCFAVLKPDTPASEQLRQELAERVVAELGKALKPDRVLFATALPKTRNAKVMRRVIRARYLGADPGDLSALENPDSVEAIAQAK